MRFSILGLFLVLVGCAPLARELVYEKPAEEAECVVLLHGLARTEISLAPMQAVLEAAGYFVMNTGYAVDDYYSCDTP